TGALWPVKAFLRLFSWISTAVVLLSLFTCYGILASVPIGLLARIPTGLVVFASLLACLSVAGVGPGWFVNRFLRSAGGSVRLRAGFVVLSLAIGTTVGFLCWIWFVLPLFRTEAGSIRELFFPGFVSRYQSVHFRRLPGIEMSEIEFWAWWPPW